MVPSSKSSDGSSKADKSPVGTEPELPLEPVEAELEELAALLEELSVEEASEVAADEDSSTEVVEAIEVVEVDSDSWVAEVAVDNEVAVPSTALPFPSTVTVT